MGIMNKIPKMPPRDERKKMRVMEGVSPKRMSAGIVKMTPAAKPSPTVAIVWTMLFSSTVEFLHKRRKMAIDIIAAGIEAEIVAPIFKAK